MLLWNNGNSLSTPLFVLALGAVCQRAAASTLNCGETEYLGTYPSQIFLGVQYGQMASKRKR